LKKCGAEKVYLIGCHGILSGLSLNEIEASDVVDGIIVTNTYPISKERRASSKKLQLIDMSGVLAEAIRRTHNGESISFVFWKSLTVAF
jgi:ribose-phosphate pyrophosphokinase